MNDNQQFDQNDLALFAMQLLSKEEEAQVKALLELSPDLRRELAEVQGDLAIYATTVDMHAPPALARERLMTQVGRERKLRSIDRTDDLATDPLDRSSAAYGAGPGAPIPSGSREPSEPHAHVQISRLTEDNLPRDSSGVGRLVPWFGWAVAAALAVTTGNFYRESQVLRDSTAHDHAELTRLTADAAAARRLMDTLKDPSATRVTLTKGKQAPVPQGKVTYVAEKGALLFVASNLDPLDSYKVYELWLIPANGQAPVPAGTFRPDAKGNASVVLPQLPTGLTAKAFGITVEDEGGAQTPTMPILLAGTAAGA